MTIVEQEFMQFMTGQIKLYIIYDDKNRPDDSTRWRTDAMRGINNSIYRWKIYVQDTSVTNPDGSHPRQEEIMEPGTDTTWPVSGQYSLLSPWDDRLEWGGGRVA